MKLWQIIAATIIFKSADWAFTAAFLLPPNYKYPPILILAGWAALSVGVWLLLKSIAALVSGDRAKAD